MNKVSEEESTDADKGRVHLPCLSRIPGLYTSFTEAERKVANYIMQQRGWVLYLPITELARNSGVSIGTVTRFCSRMGFTGFPDLKLSLAVELLNPQSQSLDPIHPTDDITTLVRKVLHFGMQSLNDTLSLVDSAQLLQAAQALRKARRVHLYATGGLSTPMAMVAQHRLLTLGISAVVFSDYAQQITAAALLQTGDVAVGFSNSGESQPVARALEAVKQTGAVTIGISSAPNGTICRLADIRLVTAANTSLAGYNLTDAISNQPSWGDAVTSRIPMLGLIDALYAAITVARQHAVEPDGS